MGAGLGYLTGVSPENLPFSATGGSKTQSGGYFYHTFDEGSSTFQIISGKGQVEVAVTGAGGAGGGGGPPSGDEAGAGGGGGGTGIFTIGELMPGTYSVSVGSGGAGAPYPPSYNPGPPGGPSSFEGPPGYWGTLVSSGGNGGTSFAQNSSGGGGGGGSWPSSPSFTINQSYAGGQGGNGDNRSPHPSRLHGPIDGGHGGDAGHYNNSGWWSPFIGPGKGGWNPSPWYLTSKSGYSIAGSNYGGGGGGAGRGGTGGSGRPGRIVIRYPDAI